MERKVLFSNHIIGLKNININFKGYILGMSHSYLGIFSHLFSEPTYKLSWNSADLHYTYHVVRKIFSNEFTSKKNLKYVIWDMPYYIFNYDYSMNGVNFRKGLTFWKYFNDTNNLCVHREVEWKRYELYIDMFGKKEKKRDDLCYLDDITWSRIVTQDEINDFKKSVSHVWKLNHVETIQENIYYFKAIISIIKAFNPNIKIIVTIFPQLRYISEYFPKEFKLSKEFFYDQLKSVKEDIIVWDYYDYYFDKENFFGDVLHLNNKGAADFTRELNRHLKDENII